MRFQLAPHQKRFLVSDKKFVLLRGGIGSGKSWVGAHYTINKLKESPYALGFIGANTYKQLHNATLKTLFIELEKLNIPFSYNQQKGLLEVWGSKILCSSLENYQALRGIEIGWFWLDEVRDTKEEAFEVIMGRLRDKKSVNLTGRLTSSPSGFDWQYDYFDGEKKSEDFEVITATSRDNPFLPDGYIDTLKATYSSKMFEQEVLGKIVNIAQGQIYYSFNRDRHVKRTDRDKRFPLWIGTDFNVNPMTSVVTNVKGDKIFCFSEIYLKNSNTYELGDTIIDKYGRDRHNIVPDSTGKALKTSSAGVSDHLILRDKGFKVSSVSNPFRMDRYNCVNGMFERGEIVIDPNCKMLIKDLEQLCFKEGSNLPDTSDPSLGHISDALGYLVWHVKPIIKREPVRVFPR